MEACLCVWPFIPSDVIQLANVSRMVFPQSTLSLIASGTSWRAPIAYHEMFNLHWIVHKSNFHAVVLFCRCWSERLAVITLTLLICVFSWCRWRRSIYRLLFLLPDCEADFSLDNTLPFAFKSLVPDGSWHSSVRTWFVTVLVKFRAQFNNGWSLQRPTNLIFKVMEPTQILFEK